MLVQIVLALAAWPWPLGWPGLPSPVAVTAIEVEVPR